MKPRILKKGRIAQLSYDLPHRIHTAHIYPIRAPNGSAIIIYGHGSGLRVLWHGGRGPRQGIRPLREETQANGGQQDVIMAFDVDDDHRHNSHRSPEEYELDEAGSDAGESYPPIVQHLELGLNVAVLHIAFPPVPSPSSLRRADSCPTLLRHKIVVAVACSDSSIRIITLPSSPPSNTRTSGDAKEDLQSWSEQILSIPPQIGQCNVPSSLAMTWTARTLTKAVEGDAFAYDDESEEEALDTNSSTESGQWDFLLASHSHNITGAVQIFRIQISENSALGLQAEDPHQIVYIPEPVLALSFNPSLFPSRRHSQLLVTDWRGVVRIYDPLRPSRTQSRINRPPSMQDSSKSGAWVASFLAPIAGQRATAPAVAKRKPVLACSWLSHGRAIIVLLEDGEWGVWCLQNAEQSRNARLFSNGAGALTFALRGFVGSTTASTISQQSDRKARATKGLAPMTPNTRKTKQEKLFSSLSNVNSMIMAKGGILVESSTMQSSNEETVLLWYNNEIYRIPSFQALWNRSTVGNRGGFLHGSGVTRIESVDSFNEQITGAQYLPASLTNRSALRPDLLVVTETRLLIHSIGERLNVEKAMQLFRQEEGDALREEGTNQAGKNADIHILSHGDLDLAGVDRLLDGMSNGSVDRGPTESRLGLRRVGFAA